MGILAIIEIVVSLIQMVLSWFGKLGSKAPTAAQIRGLSKLKNATDKLDDFYRTFGVVAASDDDMPKLEEEAP